MSSRPARANVEVLVLAAARIDGAPSLLTDGIITEDLDVGALATALSAVGFTGELDEVARVPSGALGPGMTADCVLVVGTGTDPGPGDATALGATRAGTLKRAAGCAARTLSGSGSAAFLLPADRPDDLVAVAEGALVGAYAWSGRVPAPTPPLERIVVATTLAGSEEGDAAMTRASVLSEATTLVRDLVNEPPYRLTPGVFAERARAIADEAGWRSKSFRRRSCASAASAASSASVKAPCTRPPSCASPGCRTGRRSASR